MAENVFYTPAQAAMVTANLVAEESFLSALVSRNYQDEFLGAGKAGAPIAIKQPTTLIARSREIDDVTTKIVLDQISETVVTLNLDRAMDYHAVPLTEGDLNLKITDFSAQVLKPQAEAIVDLLEHKVATTLQAVPMTTLLAADGTTPIEFDPTDPIPYFTQMRKWLRKNGVPQSGIQVSVGTEVYAALLDAKAITDVSESGSTAALREGGVGKVRGFTIVETTRLGDDEILAFHRDAVTLVTRAPAVPQGAKFGASVSERGFALRYLRDYDADYTVDRSILATFSAVGILPTYKVERNYTTRAVTVTPIANGGVLHLDATPGAQA